MAASPSRVCWDACAWIALIQQERIREDGRLIEDRYALARAVIDRAEKGALEIITSGLCLVELNKSSPTTTRDQLVAFFDSDYILLAPVDRQIGERGRSLMFEGHPGLKPPDAVYLATALVTNADELHTFDTDLLNLSEKLTKQDGSVLHICKPGLGGAPLPLFAAAADVTNELTEIDNDFYETLIEEGLAADLQNKDKRKWL